MKSRWTAGNKAEFNIEYNLVWCTKYRRKILEGDVADRLRLLLTEKCGEMNLVVESMQIMPDQVVLRVKATPVDSPHFIVQQLKGMTSRVLRAEFPEVKSRVPTLWTRNYRCDSVGQVNDDVIRSFIDNQMKH